MINHQNFKKINDSFDCVHCRKPVPAAEKTCRNHCPHCLHSLHVDILPGDRANPCQGLLQPVGYHFHSKKGLMIDFKCQKCRAKTRNIALLEDAICPDSYDQILSISPRF